jgi:hypothetical protein
MDGIYLQTGILVMATSGEYDEQKLKELILYISAQNNLSDKYGMTKLNKLLFFSDFTAYARTGDAITGATYIRMPFGPCPIEIQDAIKELKVESRIFTQKLSLGEREGSRLVAVCDANLSRFSAPEISIVDEIIRRYWDFTGTQISNASHEFVGWNIADDREKIPYYTVLIPDQPRIPSTADMSQARQRASLLFG